VWWFKRKTNWQPGDMAECVIGGDWWAGDGSEIVGGPAKGEKVMVRSVRPKHPEFGVQLRFVGYSGTRSYNARCFRKIVLTDTHADRKREHTAPDGRKVGVE